MRPQGRKLACWPWKRWVGPVEIRPPVRPLPTRAPQRQAQWSSGGAGRCLDGRSLTSQPGRSPWPWFSWGFESSNGQFCRYLFLTVILIARAEMWSKCYFVVSKFSINQLGCDRCYSLNNLSTDHLNFEPSNAVLTQSRARNLYVLICKFCQLCIEKKLFSCNAK